MAETIFNVTIPCPNCGGTGIHRYYILAGEENVLVEEPCAICEQSGRMIEGRADLATGYYWATQIFEATALKEYRELNDDEKSMYSLILSQVIVNLNKESNALTELFDIFGDGTLTRKNLETLIS